MVDLYNVEFKDEFEIICDFIIFYYYVNQWDDFDFWCDMCNMVILDCLV